MLTRPASARSFSPRHRARMTRQITARLASTINTVRRSRGRFAERDLPRARGPAPVSSSRSSQPDRPRQPWSRWPASCPPPTGVPLFPLDRAGAGRQAGRAGPGERGRFSVTSLLRVLSEGPSQAVAAPVLNLTPGQDFAAKSDESSWTFTSGSSATRRSAPAAGSCLLTPGVPSPPAPASSQSLSRRARPAAPRRTRVRPARWHRSRYSPPRHPHPASLHLPAPGPPSIAPVPSTSPGSTWPHQLQERAAPLHHRGQRLRPPAPGRHGPTPPRATRTRS